MNLINNIRTYSTRSILNSLSLSIGQSHRARTGWFNPISAFNFVTMIRGLMTVMLSGFGEAYLEIRGLRQLASVEHVFLILPLI